MDKITFVNGQAPYLSDETLNKMQDNIEEAIDKKSSLPTGGITGQILSKKSNEDNDVEWIYNDGGVTGDTVPIGAVMKWYSDTIPTNWLLLNGQAVSRTDYSELFALFNTTFGEGDGSTTFNLPDMRTRTPVGKDSTDSDFDTLGKTGGEKTHTLTKEEMPAHSHINKSHVVSTNAPGYSSWEGNIRAGEGEYAAYIASANTSEVGGNQPHNNLQPYIVTNFIIKAKQSAGIVATVVDSLESESATDALSANQGKILNEKIEQRITTGVEFATNEYIDEKQVFRKRIDIGTLPNATTKTVAHGLTNFTLIRFYGIATTGASDNYNIYLPCLHLDGLTYSVSLFVSNTEIQIKAGSDRSAYSGYVDLYYTKNS